VVDTRSDSGRVETVAAAGATLTGQFKFGHDNSKVGESRRRKARDPLSDAGVRLPKTTRDSRSKI